MLKGLDKNLAIWHTFACAFFAPNFSNGWGFHAEVDACNCGGHAGFNYRVQCSIRPVSLRRRALPLELVVRSRNRIGLLEVELAAAPVERLLSAVHQPQGVHVPAIVARGLEDEGLVPINGLEEATKPLHRELC